MKSFSRKLVTVGCLLISVIVTGCTSKELQGERAQKVELFRLDEWNEVNLVFGPSDRFFRGEAVVASEAGKGYGVVYPGDNVAIFGGALFVHALLGGVLSASEEEGREKATDEVLGELSVLVTSVDRDLFVTRTASLLEEELTINVLVGEAQVVTSPTFTTQPFFSLSQSKDFVVVSNLVEFSRPDGHVSYTNRIHLVSRPIDLAKLAAAGDTHHFFDVLTTLYMLTNHVALLDSSGQLINQSATEETFKVGMGTSYQYHRAKLVNVAEDYGVLKVLGGNLLIAPIEQIEK